MFSAIPWICVRPLFLRSDWLEQVKVIGKNFSVLLLCHIWLLYNVPLLGSKTLYLPTCTENSKKENVYSLRRSDQFLLVSEEISLFIPSSVYKCFYFEILSNKATTNVQDKIFWFLPAIKKRSENDENIFRILHFLKVNCRDKVQSGKSKVEHKFYYTFASSPMLTF